MKATIGSVVIYNTTKDQRKKMEESSVDNEQFKLPAIIVAVWGDECVNLKVLADGETDLWVTSSVKGDNEMEWNWPIINK